MPMLRSSIGTWVMSRSRTNTCPSAGSMKPVMVRSVVVLPQPDGPRNVKNSPSFTWTLMSCSAVKSPNLTTMLLSRITVAFLPLFCRDYGRMMVSENMKYGEPRGLAIQNFRVTGNYSAFCVSVAQSRLSQSGSVGALLASAQ